MSINIVLEPGQMFFIPVPNPDYSNAINLTERHNGVKYEIKSKKWGNGSMGDKNARWRHNPTAYMFSMLMRSYRAKGGKH